jgi:Tfp pilus assembly protein PilN
VAQANEEITQFEQLQKNRKVMMKAALTTMQLLEPVPRSVLLASLTNSLPLGVSLVRLNLIQKQPKQTGNLAGPANKYRDAQAKKATTAQEEVSREKLLETHIDIGGLAPSDRQVAEYITQLRSTSLLDNVALVEIKEHKVEDRTFRQFKLTAVLRKDVHLSSEDVVRIREKGRNAARIF